MSKVAGGWDILMCCLRLLYLSLSLLMLPFQGLCSMNGLFCYVLFRSGQLFQELGHSFLVSYRPCLVLKCLQLNDRLFALPLRLGGSGDL